jgi:hypothetical protein
MHELAESLLQIATSSQGVNRSIDTQVFLRSCKELQQLLECVVVDSSSPCRDYSDWELKKQMVAEEVSSQAECRKPALTDAVLVSLDCFFRCTSSYQIACEAGVGRNAFHSALLLPCNSVARLRATVAVFGMWLVLV